MNIKLDLLIVISLVSIGCLAIFFLSRYLSKKMNKVKLKVNLNKMRYIPCSDTTMDETYIINEVTPFNLSSEFEGFDRVD